jgi:integrase
MPTVREQGTGRFKNDGQPSEWEIFIENNPIVKDWLSNKPKGTREQYGSMLYQFCKDTNIAPGAFQSMDRLKARDAAWSYIKPFVGKQNSKAKGYLAALKCFYRNKDGETLPFDSRRGGKHYIPKRRIKASIEYVPHKSEMYLIIEGAHTVRDKALLLFLFQSGVRVNAIGHLKFKHVKNQLYPELKIPLTLKITDDIDTKLRGYDLPFYYTFLQGEAVETLKTYCDKFHKNGADNDDAPLFYSKLGNSLDPNSVWEIVKKCTKRAGLDPSTIWTHTVRRAFKDVIRKSDLDNDFKEAIMGHRLEGSQENYFSRNRPEDVAKEYMHINFSRSVPKSRMEQVENELTSKTFEIETLKKTLTENAYKKDLELQELKTKMQILERGHNEMRVMMAEWHKKNAEDLKKYGLEK